MVYITRLSIICLMKRYLGQFFLVRFILPSMIRIAVCHSMINFLIFRKYDYNIILPYSLIQNFYQIFYLFISFSLCVSIIKFHLPPFFSSTLFFSTAFYFKPVFLCYSIYLVMSSVSLHFTTQCVSIIYMILVLIYNLLLITI